MPFPWTINPYRGCSHSCVYCVSGDTQVLLVDGRQRAIADLRVGDWIVGTEKRDTYRHYAATEVLAHWSTVKSAYRVALADGTEIVASGDHRFLTGRGWKYVTGAMGGPNQRPYLTTNDSLLGFGRTVASVEACAEYRRGYLAGMVRGDGHLKTYCYQRDGGRINTFHQFRLALIDAEGLDRTADYLRRDGVITTRYEFSHETATRRPLSAIRVQKRSAVDRIREIIAWPSASSAAWQQGFLGGIFDAEGSRSSGVPAHQQSRRRHPFSRPVSLDSLRLRFHHRRPGVGEWSQDRADPRWSPRAPALHPPRRSGDPAEMLGRGHRRQEQR